MPGIRDGVGVDITSSMSLSAGPVMYIFLDVLQLQFHHIRTKILDAISLIVKLEFLLLQASMKSGVKAENPINMMQKNESRWLDWTVVHTNIYEMNIPV